MNMFSGLWRNWRNPSLLSSKDERGGVCIKCVDENDVLGHISKQWDSVHAPAILEAHMVTCIGVCRYSLELIIRIVMAVSNELYNFCVQSRLLWLLGTLCSTCFSLGPEIQVCDFEVAEPCGSQSSTHGFPRTQLVNPWCISSTTRHH